MEPITNPTQAVSIVEDIVKTLSTLSGGALTVIICIAVGYVVKLTRRIHNRWIPLIVLAVGMVCYPLVSSTADQPPEMAHPIVRQIGLGLVLGCVSWLMHQAFLRKILDSKMFKDDDTKPPFPPSAP
jgi:hypothetical protein